MRLCVPSLLLIGIVLLSLGPQISATYFDIFEDARHCLNISDILKDEDYPYNNETVYSNCDDWLDSLLDDYETTEFEYREEQQVYPYLDHMEDDITKILELTEPNGSVDDAIILSISHSTSDEEESSDFRGLRRRKRSPVRRSGSRRSSSRRSSSRRSSSRRTSSSRSSSTSSSKRKPLYPTQPPPKVNLPSAGYPSAGYPSSGFPSAGNPSVGYPGVGFAGAGKPSAGYPAVGFAGAGKPSAGYPAVGFAGAGVPSSGYPGGTNPSAPNLGQPGGVVPGVPRSGYPGSPTGPGVVNPGVPRSGYPGGYPTGPGAVNPGVPRSGYPGGYPTGPEAVNPGVPRSGYPGGYPTGPGAVNPGVPRPGYPGYPSSGYPGNVNVGQPRPGYPGYPNAGYPGGINTGVHRSGYPGYSSSAYPGYTNSGYPGQSFYPKKKMSKKTKAKALIIAGVTAYATYKLTKKMRGKFLSPYSMPGMGRGFGRLGGGGVGGLGGGGVGGLGGGGFGGLGGGGSMKLGKKVIGTLIKLQIAKYALKFGVKAAKIYFMYKLGRSLNDMIIEKFISRYHRQRTRHLNRRYYSSRKTGNKKEKKIEITLDEDCVRSCVANDIKTCLFTFKVHLYQSLSRACYKCPTVPEDCGRKECIVASGRRKLMTVVNKQLPGPRIQVCEGDTVLLELINEMPNGQVSIHFRGQSYPETPFMDGTPGLTQCPVGSGSSFIYSFQANVTGTSFWHAQTGLLRSEGVYGPFIVKEQMEEKMYPNLYDIDMTADTVLISEDFEKTGEGQYMELFGKEGKIHVHSLMINGRGRQLKSTDDESKNSEMYTRYYLDNEKRHRMRLISAVSSNCPVKISLLGQSVSVIAVDGSPVKPKATTEILMAPGERFDVVVESLSKGIYWLEVRGYLECSDLIQYAIVESSDAATINETKYAFELNSTALPNNFKLPIESPEILTTKQVLPMDVINCNHSTIICSQNVTSVSDLPLTENVPANITLYLSLTNRKIHNEHFYSLLYYNIKSLPEEEQVFTPQINNITLAVPPTPLLFNEKPLKKGFCSTIAVRRQHCVDDFCECIHLQELPLNFTVDIVIINEGRANSDQPQTMYLHGHKFWVLAQVKRPNISVEIEPDEEFTTGEPLTTEMPPTTAIPETVDENAELPFLDRITVAIKDSEEPLPRNLLNPILKDSITVPSGGYSIIRIKTNNPGFWLLESSSVFRSNAGMGMVFRIGKPDDFKLPEKKKKRC